MTPHQQIIMRLGGIAKLAETLSEYHGQTVPKSTVQGWKDSGLIPAKHHDDVLAVGQRIDPPVLPEDFFQEVAA
tara:strand:+ start:143 stop:364 length:222 start_codon:yes stop_codon:yes gene_type:complete